MCQPTIFFSGLLIDILLKRSDTMQVRVVDRQDQASQLAADVPGILKAASKSLRDKSVKIRAGVFQVLKELVIAVPSSFTQEIDQLMPGIIAALKVPFL